MKQVFRIVLFLSISSSAVFAQNSDTERFKKEIELRKRALELLDNYANNPEYISDEQAIAFKKTLVQPDSAVIPNDVLPNNRLDQKLAFSQYEDIHFESYQKGFEPIVKVRPYAITINKIDSAGFAYANMDFYKLIKVRSKQKNWYRDTLNMRFYLRYNWADSTLQIENIKLLEERGRYVWLKSPDKKIAYVDLEGKKVSLEKGKYLYKNAQDGDTIDVKLESDNFFSSKPITINYETLGADDENSSNTRLINFRRKLFYGLLDVGYMFGRESFEYSSHTPSNVSLTYSGQSLGFDVGFQFIGAKNFRASVLAGVRQISFNYSANVQAMNDSIGNSEDLDLDEYGKIIDLSSFIESGKSTMTLLPIQMRFDIRIGQKMELFVSGGYAFALNGNVKSDNNSILKVAGQYGEDYYGVLLEGLEEYGFGEFAGTSKEFSLSGDYSAILGSVGAVYKLSDRFYPQLSVAYLSSIQSFLAPSENIVYEQRSQDSMSNSLNSIFSSNNESLNFITINLGIKMYL